MFFLFFDLFQSYVDIFWSQKFSRDIACSYNATILHAEKSSVYGATAAPPAPHAENLGGGQLSPCPPVPAPVINTIEIDNKNVQLKQN